MDYVKIVDKMLELGFDTNNIKKGNFEGWTNTLMDALELLYDIESKVSNEFNKRIEKGE